MSTGNAAPWGGAETTHFYQLTPERVLSSVERFGYRCTGRVLALNSMENRVYEVEIEVDQDKIKRPSDKFRIAKFYRPGRWNKEQILEEHQFLLDLTSNDIPAVKPIENQHGETVITLEDTGIHLALFEKIGGRTPDEMTDDQLEWVGRLLARIHLVGAVKTAPHRVQLSPETYGIGNLRYLIDAKALPATIETRYRQVTEEICAVSAPWFAKAKSQRIHGDCHINNLLWGQEGPFFVDFDDMVRGPCVQDLWLLCPGGDEEGRQRLESLITGYEMMNRFDRESLRLIEPLRALRYVHFSSWIHRRFKDPSFPRVFPDFGSESYWRSQLADLEEQLLVIKE